MPSVPFLDLYAENRRFEAAFFRDLRDLYRQSAFVGGAWLEAFERDFAARMESPACVAVSSGTAALHLSLAAAGVGPGDEVIVPAFTFPGTAGPVIHLGAKPVFADVRAEDGCLDPEAVARARSKRTKAIVATHLFGHPAPLAALREIAGKGAVLIEDAAQAHGGALGDRPLGSIGDFGCFSFYPTKNLGGLGDGGAVLVKTKALRDRLLRLRDHGQRRRFFPEVAGFNARMDALQALFLGLKLPRLGRDNARRALIAAHYLNVLNGMRSLRPLRPGPEGASAWHAFVVRARNRAAFIRHLDAHGIGNQVYYPSVLPSLKAFRPFAKGKFPVAAELARTAVALPLHPEMDPASIRAIQRALASFPAG